MACSSPQHHSTTLPRQPDRGGQHSFRAGSPHQALRREVPCRDDESGQAATQVVDAISRCDHAHRRLADRSSTNTIRRRPCADPGQKQVPGKWITQKKGLTHRGPLRKALRANEKTRKQSHHRFTGTTRHSRTRMVLTVSFALLCDRALLSPSQATTHRIVAACCGD